MRYKGRLSPATPVHSLDIIEDDDTCQFLLACLTCQDCHPVEPFCFLNVVGIIGDCIFQQIAALRHTDLHHATFQETLLIVYLS